MQSQSDSAEENSLKTEATPTLVLEPMLAPESGSMPASEPTLAPESGPMPASEPTLAPESGPMPASELALESGPTVVFDPTPEPAPPPEPEPMSAPGEILRQAREARGESLNDVARILKLSAQQLEALEAGRYDTLPGPTFVRGFMRNYANYLELPPEPLLEGISARIPTAADLASMLKLDGNVQPAASPRPRSGVLPVVLIVLVVLALAGLIVAGIYLGWFKQLRFESSVAAPAQAKSVRLETKSIKLETKSIKLESPVLFNLAPGSENPPPPVGSELADESAGEAGVVLASTRAAAAPSPPAEATLRLLFNASTLARVHDSSGKIIFARTGIKGNTNSVKGKPPFSVMVKPAGNVKLEFNGKAVDLKRHTGKDGVANLTLQ